MPGNFYELLGVRQNAHPAEIDLAFKTINESQKSLDIELQLELSIAHQTLTHPVRREEYDRSLPPATQPVPAPLPNNIIYMPERPQPNKVLTYAILGYMIGVAVIMLAGAVLL